MEQWISDTVCQSVVRRMAMFSTDTEFLILIQTVERKEWHTDVITFVIHLLETLNWFNKRGIDEPKVFIAALRNIVRGEELTYNYSGTPGKLEECETCFCSSVSQVRAVLSSKEKSP